MAKKSSSGIVHVKAHTRMAPKTVVMFNDKAGKNKAELTKSGVKFTEKSASTLEIPNQRTSRKVYLSAGSLLSETKRKK